MSKAKVLPATCNATSVVTAEGVSVLPVTILSMGKKSSSGFLLMDGEQAYYVASNATDIKDLISSLVTIINQVATIATALDAVTVAPGSAAAAIAALQVMKTQLDATKELLK